MHKRSFGALLVAPLLLFALLASGGCGGGGGGGEKAPDERQGNIIGAPHGTLAPYLDEGRLAEAGVVLLSAPEGLTATNESLSLLVGAFEQGKAVALEHVDADEVDVLLGALELAISSPEAEDGKPFELFAVCRAGGDVHFFVALGDDGGGPVSETMTERTITIVNGPEDLDLDKVDWDALTSEDLDKFQGLDVLVSEEVVPTPMPQAEDSVVQNARVDNFIKWAEETKAKAEATASDGGSDLRELAEAYVWDKDCSDEGQTFTIRYTIYSCHSFTNDMDYYFVTQSAQLNPSKLWKWTEKGSVS